MKVEESAISKNLNFYTVIYYLVNSNKVKIFTKAFLSNHLYDGIKMAGGCKNMNCCLLFYKSTQNFSKREAVTVRKATILGDALLTFSYHEGG